jgi:hypothetical protein
MALPEIVIGSKLDAKGFKQAESATDKLTRSVKNLAATLGLAFSAAAISILAKLLLGHHLKRRRNSNAYQHFSR